MPTQHIKTIGDYSVRPDGHGWRVYHHDMRGMRAFTSYDSAEAYAVQAAAGELAAYLAGEISQCGDYNKLKAIQAILGI